VAVVVAAEVSTQAVAAAAVVVAYWLEPPL
jgi:hypothetical protein